MSQPISGAVAGSASVPARGATLSGGGRSDVAAGEGGFLGISAGAWGRVGLLAFLFACLFWPNLRRLWQKTNPFTGEANWGHSCFVPVIGLYYLYVNRESLAAAGVRSFLWDRVLRPGRLWAAVGLMA